MKIFIINLTNAVERRHFQEKQLQQLGLEYTIFPAINTDNIDKKTYQKHYYDWQRPMLKTEVACYFSHRRIWQDIINNNQAALILEDDVLLSGNTPEILIELENLTQVDLVNFEVCGRKKIIAKTGKMVHSKHQLFRLHLNKAGAAAYVLYPSGAKKLLACEAKRGIALADAHIHSCYLLKSFQIEPALAVQFMFCKRYGLSEKDKTMSNSSISYLKIEKRALIFRIKRLIAQIKLGFRQLTLILKTHKRFIVLRVNDFK